MFCCLFIIHVCADRAGPTTTTTTIIITEMPLFIYCCCSLPAHGGRRKNDWVISCAGSSQKQYILPAYIKEKSKRKSVQNGVPWLNIMVGFCYFFNWHFFNAWSVVEFYSYPFFYCFKVRVYFLMDKNQIRFCMALNTWSYLTMRCN